VSAYGRKWEMQRPSRAAQDAAVVALTEAVRQIGLATSLVGRAAILADAKRLLARTMAAKQEEIGE
jgi:hypothetical protein